jgi:XTP/dITP diphosphohydrolase
MASHASLVKLLIASRNHHKIREIAAILAAPNLEFISTDDAPGLPAVEEDGLTFEANAIKKASVLARASRLWTLADDSGLEVDALGGEPGVSSARYAGVPANDAANNRKLLQQMAGVANRTARFRCAVALAGPGVEPRVVSGACEGTLLTTPRGSNGFGYDPLFVPNGYAQTFAELPAAVKNRISHRAAALRAARAQWLEILSHP